MDISSFLIGYQAAKNAAVGGSMAGGTLPAGAYWEQRKNRTPFPYQKCRFTFNGCDYLYARSTSGNGNAINIYKIEKDAYTLVTSCTCSVAPGEFIPVELNGVLHILGNSVVYHYVFDGTTVTQKTSCPKSLGGTGVFVYNGALYQYGRSGGYYVWNESDETWTLITISGLDTYVIYHGFEYNDGQYLHYNKNLYRLSFSDRTLTLVNTLELLPNMISVINGTIYAVANSIGKQTLYTYDIENNVFNYVCEIPHLATGWGLYADGENVCAIDNGSYTDLILHIVEAAD